MNNNITLQFSPSIQLALGDASTLECSQQGGILIVICSILGTSC